MNLGPCKAVLRLQCVAELSHFCRFSSMGGYDEGMRLAAYVAWKQADGHYKEALQLFKQHTGADAISRPDRFLKYWAKVVGQSLSLRDKPRSGRPRKLSQQAVNRAVQLFLAGSSHNGSQAAFTDLNEALDKCPELRAIVSNSQMHPQTLLRNMRAANPDLVKRTEDLKPILNNKLKEQRVTACHKLLQFSNAYFRRVFWLDAKTMHISPSARKVWVDRKLPSHVKSDARVPRSGRDRRTLHFYAMVNWCAGPVAMIFVTGTSGLQHAQPYTVSHSVSKYAPDVLWPAKFISPCRCESCGDKPYDCEKHWSFCRGSNSHDRNAKVIKYSHAGLSPECKRSKLCSCCQHVSLNLLSIALC